MLIPVWSAWPPPGRPPPQLGTSVSVVSEASDPAFPSQMGFECTPPTLGRC